MITIYGDKRSGNCLKVLYVARYLGLEFEWVDVDILAGETRTESFLSLNPAGQIPVVTVDDGRQLSQSGAILLLLADGSRLVPEDPWERAKMHQWMFWEQYSHEPTIAVRRFQKLYLAKEDHEIDPVLLSKGEAALDLMNEHLVNKNWFVGRGMSLADVALVAYTRLANEGGYDLSERIALKSWITRVENELGI